MSIPKYTDEKEAPDYIIPSPSYGGNADSHIQHTQNNMDQFHPSRFPGFTAPNYPELKVYIYIYIYNHRRI